MCCAAFNRRPVKATDVQTRAVSLVKEMAGQVNGPGDALWDLHCAIARDVLERGGLSSAELREWVSVQQRREDASPGT